MRPRIHPLLVVLLPALSACTTTQPYVDALYDGWESRQPASELVYQVFLIGDAGDTNLDGPNATLALLKSRLGRAGEDAAVVFLGDNVYPGGLPDSTHLAERVEAERRLLEQLQTVEAFAGRIVFIPGDKDWNDSAPGGLAALTRQERFVEATLDRGNTFLPDEGFPGPVTIDLTDDLRLIVLDTAWWLYDYEKSFGDTGDYDLEEDANFLVQLDDVIKRSRGGNVLVVGHHPLYSNGRYAGNLPAGDHLFPLRNLHPALAIPLPLVGSLYPLYVRYLGGNRQDLGHDRYQALRTSLAQIFYQHENLIYAAAHDNALQYFEDHTIEDFPQYFIVSGGGSRQAPVSRGRGAGFTYGGQGFATLNYHADGSVWMEMWRPIDDGPDGELLVRVEIQEPARDRIDPGIPAVVEAVDYRDSTVVAAAGERYAAGALHRFLIGSHRRKTWTTPVELPVFDVGREAGGLVPLQRGGGHQTLSLRLENEAGQQFVIRTLDKDPSGTVPVNLQGTIATDFIQDQISIIQPYGSLIIPPLADAIGVYHTNPKAVYIPDDPRLGVYAETFAGQVALFEERPNDDMSHVESFGRSRDVVSAHRFYREINDDNDHRVDAHAFARARLFDMLLSDWDRHVDQWRWASFEPYELDPSLEGDARKEGKIYRPIPRDRDFAFNKMNGLLLTFADQFDPRYQDFTEHYKSIKGLAWSALPQDHRLVSPLERHDWIEIAESIQTGLTDAVIDDAVRRFPDAVYPIDGEETARLLKIRRDKLRRVAEAFYAIHARIPDVVGSNKHERFTITRFDDSTRVVVHKTSKQGRPRRQLYRRVFLNDETKEIRLYGLDGNDTFVVEGRADRGIVIRAIGGAGHDTFIDRSEVGGWGRRTRFYDTATGNAWEVGSETKRIVSDDDPAVNFYSPRGFQYDLKKLLFFFGNNSDDGLFLGGGVGLTHHGFRKLPYGASHRIKANFAAKTQAFNAVYEGHYVDVLGAWDVLLDASYFGPNTIRNFYGLGNETANDVGDREFYQARLEQATVAPSVYKRTERGAALRLGSFFEYTNVDETAGRFVNEPQAGISANTFAVQTFVGADLEVVLDTRDNAVNPKQGFYWSNQAKVNVGLGNSEDSFVGLTTDLSFYLSPSLRAPQVTLATRAGAAHNVGDFPFYSATTLGGKTNLRGHRGTRYAGRTSVHQNAEVRVSLFRFSTFLAIGKAGVLGFVDNGRVWTDGEDSDVWHQGYGGGVWFELFNAVTLVAHLGSSDDDETFALQLGFQY